MTMDTNLISKILQKISTLPTFGKVLSVIVIALVASIIIFTSCGTTRTATRVNNRANGTTTTITQTTQGGTVTIDIKPSMSVKVDSTQILSK